MLWTETTVVFTFSNLFPGHDTRTHTYQSDSQGLCIRAFHKEELENPSSLFQAVLKRIGDSYTLDDLSAAEIFRQAGISIPVDKKIETEELAGVRRPLYSALTTHKIKPLRDWKQALQAYLEEENLELKEEKD